MNARTFNEVDRLSAAKRVHKQTHYFNNRESVHLTFTVHATSHELEAVYKVYTLAVQTR